MRSYPTQPPFRPVRGASCFCGTGKPFRDCCGSFSESRALPHGVHLSPGFLSQTNCQSWVRYLERQPRQRLMVVDTTNSTNNNIVQKPDENRITEEVNCNQLRKKVNALCKRAWSTLISRAFHRRFAWFEQPVVLRYSAGGQYGIHADSDYYDPDSDTWFKCLDRDASLLIYLNDSFSGGSLRMVNFNFSHQPNEGDLLFFPSDHRYMHEAQLVNSGVRYAIVSWAAFRNQKRITNAPQGKRIRL